MNINKKICKNWENFNQKDDKNLYYNIFKKFSKSARHSISDYDRKLPDICTKIKVWKYEVMRDDKLITSKAPITTKNKYKKSEKLPQLVSCSLFGSKKIYVDGAVKMIQSMKLLGILNEWDVRIYIASKENGKNVKMSTSKKMQKILLKAGIELAHVESEDPNGYNLSGTFWRFLAVNERARIFFSDVDKIFNSCDLISLSMWKKSRLTWFRTFVWSLNISPFLAGGFGVIGKKDMIPDLINKVNYYPNKKKYGDDEKFLLDVFFPQALISDSIFTIYNYDLVLKPHKYSNFMNTPKIINMITGKPISKIKSKDAKFPVKCKSVEFNIESDLTEELLNKKKKMFSLAFWGEEGENAKENLKLNNIELHTNEDYVIKTSDFALN